MKVERASVGGSLDRSKERLPRAAEGLRLEPRTIAHLEDRLGDDFLPPVELLLASAGLVGQKISATLASTGTPSIFLHPTEAQHGDLGRIRKRDLLLAISNSGETAETNSLIGPARRIGVKIIALTGVARSTLARNSD